MFHVHKEPLVSSIFIWTGCLTSSAQQSRITHFSDFLPSKVEMAFHTNVIQFMKEQNSLVHW
uniref:Uncharacterized protein n=1 Tax=Arion vulgaris TaxID=1028688 RepID=A0A0B7AQR9_9EUPU